MPSLIGTWKLQGRTIRGNAWLDTAANLSVTRDRDVWTVSFRTTDGTAQNLTVTEASNLVEFNLDLSGANGKINVKLLQSPAEVILGFIHKGSWNGDGISISDADVFLATRTTDDGGPA